MLLLISSLNQGTDVFLLVVANEVFNICNNAVLPFSYSSGQGCFRILRHTQDSDYSFFFCIVATRVALIDRVLLKQLSAGENVARLV